jgi:hypothetical protein
MLHRAHRKQRVCLLQRLWIQFAEKQPREITSRLAELGFHWNHTRQAWQHPCGLYRHEAVSFDPRKVYGSCFAADLIRG